MNSDGALSQIQDNDPHGGDALYLRDQQKDVYTP